MDINLKLFLYKSFDFGKGYHNKITKKDKKTFKSKVIFEVFLKTLKHIKNNNFSNIKNKIKSNHPMNEKQILNIKNHK